ncbi:MAG: M1 family metallopeptidase [Bacteroidetes bacterium]|nr:M1 family metallopeptidase [Bacteroidota bacterium]
MNRFSATVLPVLIALTGASQGFDHLRFTRADSLRGGLRPERTCFDVVHYDLNLGFNLEYKEIQGYNQILFHVLSPCTTLQLDLFDNLVIDSILFENQHCKYQRDYHAIWVSPHRPLAKGEQASMRVYYHGAPIEAANPPWDGGFVWSADRKGKHWVSVACEGLGASCWWPCKDHPGDEPDSMRITLTVPKEYMAVSNGSLVYNMVHLGERTTQWRVSYPLNTYNATFYIGKLAELKDHYKGIDLRYYVLENNKPLANKHFEQVKGMMDAFEHYLGPYPFARDGYKLVEAPYWGMEHQSAIAYGNHYRNNEWGFDYIIIHESGHEWWGNNVSASDHADLWIHEAFCTYTEALYVEYMHGLDTAIAYLNGHKKKVLDLYPIRGPYHVNFNEYGTADMYYKGANMLHTLRVLLENDSLWFGMLRQMQEIWAYKTIDSKTLIDFINQKTGKDFQDFFTQYLDHAASPVLEYKAVRMVDSTSLSYRYLAAVAAFDMPIRFELGGESRWLYPGTEWKTMKMSNKEWNSFRFDEENFMVWFKRINN